MKFKMVFGLKIGCLFSISFLLGFVVPLIFAQQWHSTKTIDLPVYGLYHIPIPKGKPESISNNVYWNNLAKAFKQIPNAKLNRVNDRREKLHSRRRIVRTRIVRHYYDPNVHGPHIIGEHYDQPVWDPILGGIPVDPLLGGIPVVHETPTVNIVKATPVVVFNTMTGYVEDHGLGQKLEILVPQEGYLIRSDLECDPQLMPMLSFNDGGESIDPCTGKSKDKVSEFGLTATSGMSDVLCMLCQQIKNLQCIWQFCSHPEGVYKIKVKDKTG